MIDQALLYAQFGWAVFPVLPNSKLPHAGTNGSKDGTKDEKKVAEMFKRWPDSNVAVATGSYSNFFALDIDVKNGKNGNLSLDDLESKNGKLPETVEQFTPSGGRQLIFKYPLNVKIKNSSDQLGIGLDIRGDGGYIVVAPSSIDGKTYEWEVTHSPFEFPIAEAPQWLLSLISTSKRDFDIDLNGKDRILPDGRRNERLFEICCVARNMGLTDKAALFAYLAGVNKAFCRPPKKDTEVMTIVESCLSYKDEIEKKPEINTEDIPIWDKTKEGKFKNTSYRNCLNFFNTDEKLHSLFIHNEFSKRIEISRKPFWMKKWRGICSHTDNDVLQIKQYLTSQSYEPPVSIIREAILTVAYNHRYNPVKEYLDSLQWDGTNRVEEFFHKRMGAENTRYTRFLSKLLFCAAVKRVYEPGCEYQYMIILEGRQGVGKTLAIKALGEPWSGRVSLTDKDRDTIDKMQGLWLIEVPELEVFKKKEIESLKSFIDEPIDRARLAYGYTTESFPRQSIFIGTINPDGLGYLRDTTGNRRFLPVTVGNDYFDIEAIKRDRDQLFAEAKVLLQNGFEIFVPRDMDSEMTIQQDLRLVTDAWEEAIKRWLADPIKCKGEFVTVTDVWLSALNGELSRLTRNEQMRISNVLKKVGFKKVQQWDNDVHKAVRGYTRETSESTPFND